MRNMIRMEFYSLCCCLFILLMIKIIQYFLSMGVNHPDYHCNWVNISDIYRNLWKFLGRGKRFIHFAELVEWRAERMATIKNTSIAPDLAQVQQRACRTTWWDKNFRNYQFELSRAVDKSKEKKISAKLTCSLSFKKLTLIFPSIDSTR